MKKNMVITTAILALIVVGAFYLNKKVSGKNLSTTITDTKSMPKEFLTKDMIPQLNPPKEGDKIATIVTNMGEIKVLLLDKEAPKTVENFITHAKDNYYDGVIFHRVIKDFMIQGGDPTGDGTGGDSIWGGPFENEVSIKAQHIRGALSMANAGPNTNRSQFFIVQNSKLDKNYKTKFEEMLANKNDPKVIELLTEKYSEGMIEKYLEVGGQPNLDFSYSVFGQVLEGMDIVDAIANVEINSSDKPLKDVVIEDIIIEDIK